MRRDVCHYYEKSLPEVFAAYQAAAQQKFGKDCRAEPYHTVSFGLNFSFKYNMNGGAATVHLMPYLTGTAVDVRYSIAQLYGARYGAYDKELTNYVVGLLGVPAGDIQLNVEQFLLPQNQVSASAAPQAAAAPVPAAAAPIPPAPQPAPVTEARFCVNCGKPLRPGARFCPACGTKI